MSAVIKVFGGSPPSGLNRLLRPAAAGFACLLITACEVAPKAPVAPPAPVVVSLQELLQQAEASAKEGRREASRLQYREAAKTYPTQKAPWAKLAEDYFDAGDYGNAILAAQEVLQRDAQDVLAQSILAVGGLRVSTTALTALREQQSGVPRNTRDQAAALTMTLRRTLGEDVLVPPPTSTPAAAPTGRTGGTRAPVRPRPAPAASAGATGTAAPATVAPVRAPVATTPRPPAASAPASGNPFDKLK